jgi:futalosine hydrolase
MKILIVAATESEIGPLISMCRRDWTETSAQVLTRGEVTIEFLITGVGMIRTTYALGRALSRNIPDLCINAGIAGAFPGKFEIGDVVHVTRDSIPEMGATDSDGSHLAMNDLGLTEDISSTEGLVNTEAGAFDFLPCASGITVNKVHGDTAGIAKVLTHFSADIETMESGAFFYCCLKQGVSFLAIRAISNMVEPRDRTKWDIPLAITRLNDELKELLGFFDS